MRKKLSLLLIVGLASAVSQIALADYYKMNMESKTNFLMQLQDGKVTGANWCDANGKCDDNMQPAPAIQGNSTIIQGVGTNGSPKGPYYALLSYIFAPVDSENYVGCNFNSYCTQMSGGVCTSVSGYADSFTVGHPNGYMALCSVQSIQQPLSGNPGIINYQMNIAQVAK